MHKQKSHRAWKVIRTFWEQAPTSIPLVLGERETLFTTAHYDQAIQFVLYTMGTDNTQKFTPSSLIPDTWSGETIDYQVIEVDPYL